MTPIIPSQICISFARLLPFLYSAVRDSWNPVTVAIPATVMPNENFILATTDSKHSEEEEWANKLTFYEVEGILSMIILLTIESMMKQGFMCHMGSKKQETRNKKQERNKPVNLMFFLFFQIEQILGSRFQILQWYFTRNLRKKKKVCWIVWRPAFWYGTVRVRGSEGGD